MHVGRAEKGNNGQTEADHRMIALDSAKDLTAAPCSGMLKRQDARDADRRIAQEKGSVLDG